jgi:hypothetical protein
MKKKKMMMITMGSSRMTMASMMNMETSGLSKGREHLSRLTKITTSTGSLVIEGLKIRS